MRESLYDRFRPFKPYDLVLAMAMLVLVTTDAELSILHRVMLIVGGVVVFAVLDGLQRIIRVPTPLWQGLLITAFNTAVVTLLCNIHNAEQFTFAFYMLNVGFATVAFGEQVGVTAALLSVCSMSLLEMMTGKNTRPLAETGVTLAVLFATVAILVRINRLQQHALLDAVTGLRNHRYFQVRLRDELKRSTRNNVPTSLVLLDLDNFKKVNDQYGHAVGDLVLRGVGQVLEGLARGSDVVCRYGGEEMAVVLPETALPDALGVAERFRLAIEQRRETGRPSVTVSLGVATFPDHASHTDELIAAADKAMYRAKAAGKNCVRAAEGSPATDPEAVAGKPRSA